MANTYVWKVALATAMNGVINTLHYTVNVTDEDGVYSVECVRVDRS